MRSLGGWVLVESLRVRPLPRVVLEAVRAMMPALICFDKTDEASLSFCLFRQAQS